MDDCLAAVVVAHGAPLEIRRVPVPDLEPGALLARIVASTLCGTDVHRWRGPLRDGHSLPYIAGHEPCGVVAEINGQRSDILGDPVKPGDRIVWSQIACGTCYYCTVAHQPCVCPGRVSWGHNRCDEFPYLLGSAAEYMYVPASCQIVKVPEAVSSESAAAAACAYRTVMHGYERLGAIADHETVVIQGSGALGAFAAAVARDRGACQVLAIGAPDARLAVCRRMGADETLDLTAVAEATDRLAWVRKRTGGRGADIVIQVADSAAVPEGLAMLRDGGRFLDIGGGGRAAVAVETLPQEMTYMTVRSAEPRHWLQAIEFLAARRGRFPFEDMISARYPLEQVNEALAALARYEVVKPVITF